jgi:GTP-dependent phosphoenolpyruvate carboxykinase
MKDGRLVMPAEPGDVIFSNVLVRDGRPYWLGMLNSGDAIPIMS